MDRIVEDVWEGDPPETAVKAAQIYVSQLRKLVGERLESRAPGYRLVVDAGGAGCRTLRGAGRGGRALRGESRTKRSGSGEGRRSRTSSDLAFARDEAATPRGAARRGGGAAAASAARTRPRRQRRSTSSSGSSASSRCARVRTSCSCARSTGPDARPTRSTVYRRLRERLDDELGLAPSPAAAGAGDGDPAAGSGARRSGSLARARRDRRRRHKPGDGAGR